MNKSYLIMALAITTMAFSCKKKEKKTETSVETEVEEVVKETSEAKKLKIKLEPKSDSNVNGTVVFKEENGTVSMTALMDGLSEGSHAIHIHEKSDCSAPDGTSTGGHWNPTASPHGKWGSDKGYHRGDIGNFKADANGNGTITLTTDEWCIGCDDSKKNIVGKAIIVHQGTDDFTTQPTGDAGGRVSCGGIIQ